MPLTSSAALAVAAFGLEGDELGLQRGQRGLGRGERGQVDRLHGARGPQY